MTADEAKSLVQLLQKLKANEELPYDVFLEFARLMCFSIVELVPLRFAENSIQVLLLERPKTDTIWAGMLHTPGTVIRGSDADGNLDNVLKRLVAKELPGVTFASDFVYLGPMLHRGKRGPECASMFYTAVTDDNNVGEWHDVRNLPENVIDYQRAMIISAAQKYNDDHKLGVDLTRS